MAAKRADSGDLGLPPVAGRRSGAEGDADDVLERLREAEERFRVLVEQLPLVVYIDAIDDASSTIYSSPQVEAMLGFSPVEWRRDPDLFVRMLHPEDRVRVLEAHRIAH